MPLYEIEVRFVGNYRIEANDAEDAYAMAEQQTVDNIQQLGMDYEIRAIREED